MSTMTLRTLRRNELPEECDSSAIYHLEPRDPDEAYYSERTDRNIGWITKDEQSTLIRGKCVGVAGNGGMGATLVQGCVRLGIGRVHSADNEVFDVSNINRQLGAGRYTVGHSKALTTARIVRQTSDDTTLVVYPQGITEETVDHFLDGCDVVCDEIEFWAVGSRILLHQRARARGISIFNCNTVGFGTRLFLFTPEGATIESCVSFDYKEAKALQQKIQGRTASRDEVRLVMDRMLTGLVPELPRYTTKDSEYNDLDTVLIRLYEEGKAPIIASNPIMAAGFLMDHVLFHLLRNSKVKRDLILPPDAPGYLYFDAAKLKAQRINRGEVTHE